MRQDETAPHQPAKPEELPYAIELWREDNSAVEKVLARAAKVSLARAIFVAAAEEHPGYRLTLRHAGKLLEDTQAGNSG